MKLTHRQCEILLMALEIATHRELLDATDAEALELERALEAEHDLKPGEMVRHTITGTLDLGELVISVDEALMRRMIEQEAVMVTHMTHVAEARDALVHEAMRQLGWTPPKSSAH